MKKVLDPSPKEQTAKDCFSVYKWLSKNGLKINTGDKACYEVTLSPASKYSFLFKLFIEILF